MNKFDTGIISLIESAITAQPISLPKDFNWNLAFTLSRKHQITTLIYYGIHHSKCELPKDILQAFKKQVAINLIIDETQAREIQSIQNFFEKNQIHYLPLKGTEIKPLYPDCSLRAMSDIDILIQLNQYDKIIPILTSLGYIPFCENAYEYKWCKSEMVFLELHKQLTAPQINNYNAFYGNGWNLAIPCEPGSHQFRLSNEDQFIFLFTHFTKHYKNGGGIGIRHLVDLWIYQNAYPDMDFSYIQTELSKLHLFEFYKNIRDVLDVWFGERASDERTDFITNRIFESGSYGTEKSKAVAFVVKTSPGNSSAVTKRNKEIIRRIFLPLDQMISRFPVVKRLPFLLPFFWLVRILEVIFDRDKLSKQKEFLASITPEKIEQYKKELEFVGLK